MDIAGLPGRGGDCILLRALHKPLHNILPTMPNKPDGCCHGRGREFESRRPRHSFRKSYANFDETNGVQKDTFLHPFCVLSTEASLPSLRVSYAQLCCKSETDVPVSTEENTSESTAACAACFAGVIACV